jgi:hypothetical protein
MILLLIFLATSAATAADVASQPFQPNWEKGLAHFPQVVEQRMLRIQKELFDMIHKRELDKLHTILTLVEDALLPINLPALKTPVEEHLGQLHEHYVEQSGSLGVAPISQEEIARLKLKFHS